MQFARLARRTLSFLAPWRIVTELAKVVHLVSTSNESFDDAVRKGVKNASKTLRKFSGVNVSDWTGKVENGEVVSYKVTMDVAFSVEDK